MVAELAVNHRKMLVRESRIARDVIRARGYRPIRQKVELERLGFSRAQRNTPGLLIPIYGSCGDVVDNEAQRGVASGARAGLRHT